MRTKNVQVEIDCSDVWSVDARFVRRTDQYLRTGDLLVSSANSWNLVGKCCWVPEEAAGSTFGGFISTLRPNQEVVDPKYLFHWFSSPRIQSRVRSFGRQTTNISNLDFARCLALPIPLPSLAEQERIASILDAVDALRAKRRNAIALVDDLTQSIFLNTFGDPESNPHDWSRKRFRDLLATPLRNGLSPSTGGAVSAKVLTLSAVTGSRFNPTAFKIGSFNSKPPDAQAVRALDFLICRGNGNIQLVGKGDFPQTDMPDTTFPDTIIAARPNYDLLTSEFLHCIWRMSNVRHQIESAVRTTNGTFKVNQTMLELVAIPVPPLELQASFTNKVRQISSVLTSQESHLAELDALFASLQHRAFRGELRDTSAA